MDEPACKTCLFWFFDPRAEGGTWLGECRRNAPKAVQGRKRLWPKTKGEDFCGEHPDFAKFVVESQRDDDGAK